MGRTFPRGAGWIFATGAWAPILVFLVHTVMAFASRIYAIWPKVDIPAHVLGGVAIAYFVTGCFSFVPASTLGGHARKIIGVLLIVGLTSTAAVLWEFAEYFADSTFGTKWQRGLVDTLLDLALGMAGGAGWAVLALRTGRLESAHAAPAAVSPCAAPSETFGT